MLFGSRRRLLYNQSTVTISISLTVNMAGGRLVHLRFGLPCVVFLDRQKPETGGSWSA